MIPYLVVFFFTLLFTFFAQQCFKLRNNVLGWIFSFIVILIPSLLAGFRNSGIGTDTLIYVDKIFADVSRYKTWGNFFKAYFRNDFSSTEFLYLIINFLVSKYLGSLFWLYFTVNFIVVTLFYLTAYKNRDNLSMRLFMAFFLFLYYNQTYNIVRQSLAISISLFAFQFIERKNVKMILISSLFIVNAHSTGIFFIIPIIIYYILSIKNPIKRNRYKIIFTILCIGALLVIDKLVIGLVAVGILPGKFLMYVADDSAKAFVKSIFVLYILFMLFLYYSFKFFKNVKIKEMISKYAYIKMIGVLIFVSSIISKWGMRVGFYINVLDCLLIPRIIYLFKTQVKNKSYYYLLSVGVFILLFFVWYNNIVTNNSGETYPYKSIFLDNI